MEGGSKVKLQVFISYKTGKSNELYSRLHSHLEESGHEVISSEGEMSIPKRHNNMIALPVFDASVSTREEIVKLWTDKESELRDKDPHFATAIRFITRRQPPVNPASDSQEFMNKLSDTIVEALTTELAFREKLIDPRQSIDHPAYGSPAMDPPLLLAVKSKNKENVSTLLQARANVNISDMMGWSALHWAAMTDGVDTIASALIVAKADLNQRSQTGHAPLHVAAEFGKPDMAKLLLLSQADVNMATKNGSSPLYMAVESKQGEMAALLIANKADVNLANVNGATPLFVAAQSGPAGAALARTLIQHQADVNQATADFVTPLIVAAYTNSEQVVSVLLDAGADKDLRDEDGTALDTAVALGHDKVARLLKNHVTIRGHC